MEPSAHWERIYTSRSPTEVGWYEPEPTTSMRLVDQAITAGAASVIDIGGGASFLVDGLVERELERVAVVDISEAGLSIARRRLGSRARKVAWIVGDVAGLRDVGRYDVWHDRAVLHFLLEPAARRNYVALAGHTVPHGGTAVIAGFAPDGPERCSGLPVRRIGADELAREFGSGWRLAGSESHRHRTPGGVEQRFVYVTLERIDAST
jgi:SAM-dependent methyltransferase